VDLARTAGRVRKGVSPIDYVFSQKRAMLVRMIEFDEEWSGPWIAAHLRPADAGADAYKGRANGGDQHEAGQGSGLVNYRSVWHTPADSNARAYAIRPYAAPGVLVPWIIHEPWGQGCR